MSETNAGIGLHAKAMGKGIAAVAEEPRGPSQCQVALISTQAQPSGRCFNQSDDRIVI